MKKDGAWWFFDTSEASFDPSEITFGDVGGDTPHSEDIKWLAQNGISKGWDVGGRYEFRGMDTVKRQDMAAFLYRFAGSPEYEPPSESPFLDVSSGTPHYKEICWLASTGVSRGWDVKGGKEFRGMDSVKRQDMAAFLRRLSDYCGKGGVDSSVNPFSDVDSSTPHHEDIFWLAGNRVSTGWDEGNGIVTFRGMDSVRRQDMAAFLHRMSDYGLV